MAKRNNRKKNLFDPSMSLRFFENPRGLVAVLLAVLFIMVIGTICYKFAGQNYGEATVLEVTPSEESSTQPSTQPSAEANNFSSMEPSAEPDDMPSPSIEPTARSSGKPMEETSAEPYVVPSIEPTEGTTVMPSQSPSDIPAAIPSVMPTSTVSMPPTTQTSLPTQSPSASESPEAVQPDEDVVYLPIIKLHHFVEDGEYCNDETITRSKLEEILDTLDEHGYTTISAAQLIAWRDGEGILPEKPVLLTLDDGYRSNYTIAYPVIRSHDAKAIIAVVGWSVGRTTYTNEEYSIIPHFSWSEAAVMMSDGGLEISSHTYNMHGSSIQPGGDGRYGVGKQWGENDEDYYTALYEDISKMEALIKENIGQNCGVFVYPYGKYDSTSERVLDDLGIPVSLITEEGMNELHPNGSLRKLKRYDIMECTDVEEMISGWDEYYKK